MIRTIATKHTAEIGKKQYGKQEWRDTLLRCHFYGITFLGNKYSPTYNVALYPVQVNVIVFWSMQVLVPLKRQKLRIDQLHYLIIFLFNFLAIS